MTPSVSIIVPAYNAEKKISKCLESLIKQTLQSIEIIIVNDGSTDGTIRLCREYERIDSRVVVVDQNNRGVAVARKAGLSKATGIYVGFCDADDYVEPEMYQRLFEAAELGADIASCGYRRDFLFLSQKHLLSYPVNTLLNSEYIHSNMLLDLYSDKADKIDGLCSMCNKIFRREFLSKNGIQFPTGWDHAEDASFTIQALIKAQGFIVVPDCLYHYVKSLDRKSLTSKPRPDFFALEMRYRHFLRDTIGVELNFNPDDINECLMVIDKAEKNAVKLIVNKYDLAARDKWLKFIFDHNDYRHALSMCPENELSEFRVKERDCVVNEDYDKWIGLICALAKKR